eukprot:TRINITY_DN16508_c0_g1_i1.p1 TRINITY_DN16508_c0_g1~~TRINITY_DN16508_c0_g1_i1.p1  ORF type:complete len:834 (-),score=194.69 TRINITY_DN16508_c0_g1_i1:1366-3867(-)
MASRALTAARTLRGPRNANVPEAVVDEVELVVDDSTLSSHIANNEDLGPIIRSAFEINKADALLHQVRSFVRKKEIEIEDLCKLHYEEFIHAVDELRYVLVDADELKHGLNMQNIEMQDVGNGLLRKLDELIESHGIKSNLVEAIGQLRTCKIVMDLAIKANEAIAADSYYQALKILDTIERDHLALIPAKALRAYLERQIPACRTHIERKVNVEFNDWLVHIRSISKDIGKQAIGQASSARQREVELGERQRQAEEQTRSGQRSVAYMLEVEEPDEDGSLLKFDVTPVYRAYYINTCLRLQEQFREYYYDNRKLQLNSDLQFSSGQFVPQAFNQFCTQVAGFFIVEDRVMRTAGGLITNSQVDNMWEVAIAKMKNVMDEQFVRMTTCEHMLLVKDDASLLCASLRRYGFQVMPLLNVLDTKRDTYHELLLKDSRRQIIDTLANDKYEQMVMRKEFEYSMNVLAFHIQSSDIMPAFPYIAPFSASVPEICRTVRSFIDASVSFLQHSGQMEQYDAVKKYLDRLLATALNDELLKTIKTPTLQVAHAMQIAANMTVLERACSFFAEHAAKLSGIPARLVESAYGGLASRAVLRTSQDVAYEVMIKLIKNRIDDMLSPHDQINWMPSEPQPSNDHLIEVIIFLETMLDTARQLLPLMAFEKVASAMISHVSERLVGALCGDQVKKVNLYAVQGLDGEIRALEAFADNQYVVSGLDQMPGVPPLRSHLAELRQLVLLILSNQPEHFLSKPVREKSYPNVRPEKVIIVCEKFRDAGDTGSLFGAAMANRNPKLLNKKKGLEALARKLKEDLHASGGGPEMGRNDGGGLGASLNLGSW